jgi:hypothetical protein
VVCCAPRRRSSLAANGGDESFCGGECEASYARVRRHRIPGAARGLVDEPGEYPKLRRVELAWCERATPPAVV